MGGGSFGYLFTLVFGLEMHKNKKIPCAPIKISKKKNNYDDEQGNTTRNKKHETRNEKQEARNKKQ